MGNVCKMSGMRDQVDAVWEEEHLSMVSFVFIILGKFCRKPPWALNEM